jgi:coenzyme F420 hydrogenase subunit beta
LKQHNSEDIYKIVEQSQCIGCGLCQGIVADETIQMKKASNGYLQPIIKGDIKQQEVIDILNVCPSRQLTTLPARLINESTQTDKIWGHYQSVKHCCAADEEQRYKGSSGGILTALAIYLLESDTVDFILHAKPSSSDPTFGEQQLSFSREDVLQSVGSRYGPTSMLENINALLDRGERFAIIGKPCDLSALRNLALIDKRVNELVKYWLTLVCGGFMPPEGTTQFLNEHLIKEDEVSKFRYRGYGFPGPTHVETSDGKTHDFSYYDFWGEDYKRWTLPHRCKICPDSIGEVADIVAADPWPGGGPNKDKVNERGNNVVIVRTVSGAELLDSAFKAGFIELEEETSIEVMNDYQPHQVARKYSSWPRFQGLIDQGHHVPETHGLRTEELSNEMSEEFNDAQRKGMSDRVKQGKAKQPRD